MQAACVVLQSLSSLVELCMDAADVVFSWHVCSPSSGLDLVSQFVHVIQTKIIEIVYAYGWSVSALVVNLHQVLYPSFSRIVICVV